MSCCTRLVFATLWVLGIASPVAAQPLPWQREVPLREAARSVVLKNTLNSTNPLPDWSCYPKGQAMTINNLKMRTTLWGTPDRVTLSLMKNNVWDRRINTRGIIAPTLQEIIEGALDPANKDFAGVAHDCQRPMRYGYLLKGGGFCDPYREPLEYPMPCQKPVGQIIVGMDALAGAAAPEATQSCANGIVMLEQAKGGAKARLQYVLGMTNDLYAIRGEFTGIGTPVWLRLYRHRDTTHLNYMSADGKTYTRKGAEADKAFNYPMDPPTSGKDGRYFWIRQQMPPEKTFPQGFEYVLMGLVITPGRASIETVEGKTGLGTPPPDKRIAEAPGAAATVTVTFTPEGGSEFEALVTVVTTLDGSNVLAVARQRLAAAEAAGFDGVAQANTRWWSAFYDRRENGRVFYGTKGMQCTDDITLDSPKEQKEMMLRTAKKLSNAGTTAQTQILLGQHAKPTMWNIFDAESLLNSRSGRMHLFPAVAPGTEVAFRNFQARGAFVVSAARNAREVYFLEVQARRDGVGRIMNPWPGRTVIVREAGATGPVALKVDQSNGECLEFQALAGKTYSITARGAPHKTAFGDPDKIDVLVIAGSHRFDREPVAWTRQYGRSRVFNLQFGQDAEAYACPEYRDLIVRGIRWTAGTIK